MNVQHVVFLGSDSKVHETYWWDGRWYANCLCDAAGGAARGTGRAATYTLGDEQHAIYRGYESHVHELWGSDGNWHHNDLTEATDWAPPAASDPVGYVMGASQHVVYRGYDSHIHELWWDRDWDSQWRHSDLTEASGNAPPAAGHPAGYVMGNSQQHVVYRGYDSHIHELWWDRDDPQWHHNDLTDSSGGAPPAASDPAGYVMGASQHVVYRGYDSHIHELWWDRDWDSQWRHSDLTEASGNAPPAAGHPAGYVMGNSQQHVVYRGYDSHIHELWWDRDDPQWHHNDLTDSSGGAPPAASDPAGYVMGASQHVVYRGHDSHIHELWWWDGHWAFGDLTQQTGGWAQAVGAPTGNSWPGDVLAG